VLALAQLARSPGFRLNGVMRGRAILVLLGLTAFGAYSVGRQSAPVSNAPVAAMTLPPTLAKPVAFSSPAAQAPAPATSSRPTNPPTPSAKVDVPDKSVSPATKRKVEAALTAAAIAAIIVQASRAQYHAGDGPAPAQMTPCEMAGRAAGGARAPDRAVLRRCAIRAM
jgi:hypothetical protein